MTALLFVTAALAADPSTTSAAPISAPAASAPEAGPCGWWSGVQRVGTRWRYALNQAGIDRSGGGGSRVIEVAALQDGRVTLLETGAYLGDLKLEWTRTEVWRCDQRGGSLVSFSNESRGEDYVQRASNTYEPGWLRWPAEPTDWKDAWNERGVSISGEKTANAVTCKTKVKQGDERDVVSRHISTLVITPRCKGDQYFPEPPPYTLGAGVGVIAVGEWVLVEYSP